MKQREENATAGVTAGDSGTRMGVWQFGRIRGSPFNYRFISDYLRKTIKSGERRKGPLVPPHVPHDVPPAALLYCLFARRCAADQTGALFETIYMCTSFSRFQGDGNGPWIRAK